MDPNMTAAFISTLAVIAAWETMKWIGRRIDRAIDRWADRYVARQRERDAIRHQLTKF